MKKKQQKLFIVRKYIWATNAREAIKNDKNTEVADCWLDDDWKKQQEQTANAIGFTIND